MRPTKSTSRNLLMADQLVRSIGTSVVSEPAAAPQHAAPQHPASRSLWIGGLSAEVSDALLQSRLEEVRGRAAMAHGSSAGWRDFGSFAVRRMQEASGVWVDFTSPALAQEVITVLNGSTLGPGAILVRYSRQVTRPSPSPSPSPDQGGHAGTLSSSATRARASSRRRRPVRLAQRCPIG